MPRKPYDMAFRFTPRHCASAVALLIGVSIAGPPHSFGQTDKAPPLAGPQFQNTWNGAPLAALVARILSMPPEKPNTLSQEQSVAVLTYVLWYNGLPLGNVPLPSGPDV